MITSTHTKPTKPIIITRTDARNIQVKKNEQPTFIKESQLLFFMLYVSLFAVVAVIIINIVDLIKLRILKGDLFFRYLLA